MNVGEMGLDVIAGFVVGAGAGVGVGDVVEFVLGLVVALACGAAWLSGTVFNFGLLLLLLLLLLLDGAGGGLGFVVSVK